MLLLLWSTLTEYMSTAAVTAAGATATVAARAAEFLGLFPNGRVVNQRQHYNSSSSSRSRALTMEKAVVLPLLLR